MDFGSPCRPAGDGLNLLLSVLSGIYEGRQPDRSSDSIWMALGSPIPDSNSNGEWSPLTQAERFGIVGPWKLSATIK